jgi:hypothetical protein
MTIHSADKLEISKCALATLKLGKAALTASYHPSCPPLLAARLQAYERAATLHAKAAANLLQLLH